MSQHAVLSASAKVWRSFPCPRSELRLDLTLGCGQTFRWRETADGHWTGVMGGRVWTLTQTDDHLWYHTYGPMGKHHGKGEGRPNTPGPAKMKKPVSVVKEECQEPVAVPVLYDGREEKTLRDYFQLGVSIQELYQHWAAVDHHFSHVALTFTGVRMLRQNPMECLFSFICTSNNHISRIQGMVERLCATLGAPLCQLDDTSYHDFPTLKALADSSVEGCLRNLGFGYRARFLHQSAKQILDTHGQDWLQGLRDVPYAKARDALRTLPGVGLKVADCVCLMALDKPCALPVDTHMWQIAQRDYHCDIATAHKSLTDKVYRDVGDFFRKLWGSHAGWAHSVLFCADLKKFQNLKGLKTEGKTEVQEGTQREIKRKGKKNIAKNKKCKMEEI